MSSQLAEFQECLRSLKRIVALVGAGLSASLGLPTFRGSQGLWKNFNMIDLATPDAFYIDPGLVWQFYLWRRHQALQAHPNEGHRVLAKLAEVKSKEFITITQNVDGLLARAGHPLKTLYEIHGSLFQLRCTSFTCTFVDRNNVEDPLTPALDQKNEYVENVEDVEEKSGGSGKTTGGEISSADDSSADNSGPIGASDSGADCENSARPSPEFTPTKELAVDELPKCPVCDLLMRPGVVWFGESLPLRVLDGIDNFLENGKVDLILVIGTSGTVYPANSYVELVRQRGGHVAIFNTDIEPDVMEGKLEKTWGFQGDAAEWLPKAIMPVIADQTSA